MNKIIVWILALILLATTVLAFDVCNYADVYLSFETQDHTDSCGIYTSTPSGNPTANASTVPTFNKSGAGGSYSMNYDGTGDFFEFDSTFDGYFDSHAGGSLSLWFKIPEADTVGCLFGLYPIEEIINLEWDNTNEYLTFSIYDGGSYCFLDTPTHKISKGTWHHLVMALNQSTGNADIWIDGNKTIDNGGCTAYGSDQDRHSQVMAINSGNDLEGALDEIKIYPFELSDDQIFYLYNYGTISPDYQMNITYPSENEHINSLFSINATTDYSATCSINHTNWTLTTSNNTVFGFQNSSALAQGFYSVLVNCSNGSILTNRTRNFYIDLDLPLIIPHGDLLNNNTIVFNGTLQTEINFSDNIELYSINITLFNGSTIFNISNIGAATYSYDLSYNVPTDYDGSIDVRVCDAHTAVEIQPLDVEYNNNELTFVMKESILGNNQEWIKIYPKDNTDYIKPSTNKKTDRVEFTFNKKTQTNQETFIVESSHPIDIVKGQHYKGHLVVPDIKDGYWVDFENEFESSKVTIKRINDFKVEVTVIGLSGSKLSFNSIGELNCETATYYYNNLNIVTSNPSSGIVGEQVTFKLNITNWSAIVDTVNATLYFNGSSKGIDTDANFSINFSVDSIGTSPLKNSTWYWTIEADGVKYNTTLTNFTTINFYLDNCTSGVAKALNFSIRDEENNSLVVGDATCLFNYTVYGLTSRQYSLNIDDENNFSICISPASAEFTGSYTITYDATNYPQRIYSEPLATYNNVTQNINLYLLKNTEGIYARFQTVNAYNEPIEEVKGVMQGTVDGSTVTIETEYSDDSGLLTFWVNPDNTYTFTFTKTGYETQSFSLRPTTTEIYTVTMGSSTSVTNSSYGTGISYQFYPSGTLTNNTNYDFSFNLTSSYWTITGCTFYLMDGSTTIASTSGYTSTACNLGITQNTYNYTTILAKGIYYINGTEQTVQREYSIYSGDGDFSLKNFIDDLTDFGEWGFNDFTRMVIALIIIIAILAGTASKSGLGITDQDALVLLTLALVWAFSYIGWFTVNYAPIPSTFLKKYIILFLSLLIGGGYLIKKHTD